MGNALQDCFSGNFRGVPSSTSNLGLKKSIQSIKSILSELLLQTLVSCRFFYCCFNVEAYLRGSFSDLAEIHFPPIFFCYSPRSYYVRASISPKNFGPKWPRAPVMPKNAKTASQGTKNEHFSKSQNLLLDSHSLKKFGGMID